MGLPAVSTRDAAVGPIRMSDPPTARSRAANVSAAPDEARWRDMMIRAQGGDRGAYHTLLEELAGAIAGYLRSRFGDHAWVEDCTQECLVTIHRARHSYDPARPFRPWLFALVKHKAIDVLRHRSFRVAHEAAGEAVETAAAPADGTEHRIDAAALLDRLPDGDRAALVMTKIEGMTVEQAAERLGVTPSAVKSRVSRGIKKLQHRLRAEIP